MRNIIIVLILAFLSSCTWDHVPLGNQGYPEEVGEIILNSCATSGCHNDVSYPAAGGLNLSTWEALYRGSSGGSAVVPFTSQHSFFLYFLNTDTSEGIVLSPTMPLGQPPLNEGEYLTIKNWIEEGGRNENGEERFPPAAARKKWYVANQGCDLVSVFDAESRQIMRYVEVGNVPGFVESPHMIKVSPDGAFWYVIFLVANPYVEKYSALDDELVARIEIGSGDWNTFSLSPDGRFGFSVAYSGRQIAVVDLVNELKIQDVFSSNAIHGSFVNPAKNQLYVTLQDESEIFVYDFDSSGQVFAVETVDLVQQIPPQVPGPLWPHEVHFTNDGSRYVVSCQKSNEVRIFNGSDTLLAAVKVGDWPSEFAISEARNLCFVSCMEDVTTFSGDPNKRGSIAVIDLNSNTLVKSIYPGFQPHGLFVDDEEGIVAVGNRNTNPDGPAPHHTTDCGGRNGYLTIIDMNNLELVEGFKTEVSVDPYSIALKK